MNIGVGGADDDDDEEGDYVWGGAAPLMSLHALRAELFESQANPNPSPSPSPNPSPNPNPNPNPNPIPDPNPNFNPNLNPTPAQALAAAARAREAARRGEEVAGHVPLSYRGKRANSRASEGSAFSGVGAYCQAVDAGVSTLCGASYER